ncbi:MAG: transporter [Mycobacteriaceae bacterium]
MSSIVYVLIVFGSWAGLLILIWRGWRNRERRQRAAIGLLPTIPKNLGIPTVRSTSGLYVGSTMVPSWQDRIVTAGLGHRARAQLTGYESGILLRRTGEEPIWMPWKSIVGVRTERGLAGKVLTSNGLLVIRWVLSSGTEIDTGFRADDKDIYPSWTSMATQNSAVDRG